MKFREAHASDLDKIVAMLADDDLGAQREDYRQPLPNCYQETFREIDRDPNNELIVVEKDGQVVGTLQLTFIPNITFQGGIRAQIEGVRVHRDFRNQGLGKVFFEWAIQRARERGCHLVQLTTNKNRDQAYHFYEQLGFSATHEGMKLYLKPWQREMS